MSLMAVVLVFLAGCVVGVALTIWAATCAAMGKRPLRLDPDPTDTALDAEPTVTRYRESDWGMADVVWYGPRGEWTRSHMN